VRQQETPDGTEAGLEGCPKLMEKPDGVRAEGYRVKLVALTDGQQELLA